MPLLFCLAVLQDGKVIFTQRAPEWVAPGGRHQDTHAVEQSRRSWMEDPCGLMDSISMQRGNSWKKKPCCAWSSVWALGATIFICPARALCRLHPIHDDLHVVGC